MNVIATPRPVKLARKPKPSPSHWWWWFFMFSITITILLMKPQKGKDFVVKDEQGNVSLSEERQKKLSKKLKEMDEAEQYVLRAKTAGYYPCYSCPDSVSIFLLPTEVWRYGVTTKGQHGRYDVNYLNRSNLVYIIQFAGTLQECLKEEQRKIYNYALLPENLKRDVILIRPPGNKVDH